MVNHRGAEKKREGRRGRLTTTLAPELQRRSRGTKKQREILIVEKKQRDAWLTTEAQRKNAKDAEKGSPQRLRRPDSYRDQRRSRGTEKQREVIVEKKKLTYHPAYFFLRVLCAFLPLRPLRLNASSPYCV
jgi:hypothetical protein